MGRILAIDYGQKRSGLALSDELKISINPLPTILTDQLEDRLNELIETFQIDVVVMGVSYHVDGTLTRNGKTVKTMVEKLSKRYPEVKFEMVDEGWTSADARQMMIAMGLSKKARSQKEKIDQVSAGLILKEYLNQTDL